MSLSNKIFQRLISTTLLLALSVVLFNEIEVNILIKKQVELHPAKTNAHVELSPLLEENDGIGQDTQSFVLNEFIFKGAYTCIYPEQDLHAVKKSDERSIPPALDLYITFRTFRI